MTSNAPMGTTHSALAFPARGRARLPAAPRALQRTPTARRMAAQGSRHVAWRDRSTRRLALTRLRARSFRAAAALAERAAAAQRDAFAALLARVLGALPPSGTPLSAHELAASAAALGLQPQELAALAEGCAAAFRRAAAEGYNPQARHPLRAACLCRSWRRRAPPRR